MTTKRDYAACEAKEPLSMYVVRALLPEPNRAGLHITLAFLGEKDLDGLKVVVCGLALLLGHMPLRLTLAPKTDPLKMLGPNRDIPARGCEPATPELRTALAHFFQNHNVRQAWMDEQGLPIQQEPNYHISVKPGTEETVLNLPDTVKIHKIDIKPLGKPAVVCFAL